MKLISHRGNITGPNKERENTISYINEALLRGYDVEIDVWNLHNEWYLGHDEPLYKISYNFLTNKKFWCHAKNKEALYRLSDSRDINYFWHDKDNYTLTSKGYIWCNINVPLIKNSICVLPEKGKNGIIENCYGICSDNIIQYTT